MLIGLTQSLSAATITVNGQTGDPPGTSCDLVEAIENANNDADTNTDCIGSGAYGADTIELTEDVTFDTNPGGMSLPLVVSTTIEIQGYDHTIRRLSGAPDFGIFSVFVSGDLTLRNTTVSGGSYSFEGGGIYNVGTLTLTNSTVSGNSATAGAGGGIDNIFGTVSLFNSTVSGNSADFGRGGGINNFGTLTLTHSTVSGNSASEGGGIFNDEATVDIADSLLANSASGGNCFPADAITTDLGNNFADDGSASCGAGFGLLTGFDHSLADNGGPTKTHALLDGSSAIDQAGACGTTDQRGASRGGRLRQWCVRVPALRRSVL